MLVIAMLGASAPRHSISWANALLVVRQVQTPLTLPAGGVNCFGLAFKQFLLQTSVSQLRFRFTHGVHSFGFGLTFRNFCFDRTLAASASVLFRGLPKLGLPLQPRFGKQQLHN